MSTKLLAAAIFCCSVAYGAAGQTIGTATVRGNVRVDGNQVTGDATLFDGTKVETAAASATLRMSQRSIIEMSTGTRSVIYGNYVRLEQGTIDFKPTCGFVAEVNGVRVTPNSSNTHGVISLSSSGASLSSQSGEFLILDKTGRLLSRIPAGSSQPIGTNLAQLVAPTYVGNVSVVSSHRILTLLGPDANTRYELQGQNIHKLQGRLMEIDGDIDPNKKTISAWVDDVIATSDDRRLCVERIAVPYRLLVGAAAVGAGFGAGFAVGNQPSTPASR